MSKRRTAMVTALALWRFARQMDEMEKEEINRSKSTGMTRYTFWFAMGPKNFRTTSEIRNLAKQIARSQK